MSVSTTDKFGRPLRDLRISVTDRCNFRCRYCMPAEVFGPDYAFLPKDEILSFEEISQLVQTLAPLGIRKIRLTGGEPLLRRGIDDLVGLLSAIDGVDDLAITTNGVLLAHHAEALALAGLNRVTVSLDALDQDVFTAMNGVGAKVDRVLTGIRTARLHGLPVKINAVIQRGVNESEILPLVRMAREEGVVMRFIEYMDVGETNGWNMKDVVPMADILETIQSEFPLKPLDPTEPGEVAKRFRLADGSAEIGIISSVTKPFCTGCQRLRLSADGQLFTCLFAAQGHDVKQLLRGESPDETLRTMVSSLWSQRTDRYSEERGQGNPPRAEMSYLGG
ncbi:MAG: GTP 3',8-cyclase MoaA [Akkermansiaceae bacterium]|nr:GTP 3',8-cyclase MoaA [Akkermansiaceae bacterium]